MAIKFNIHYPDWSFNSYPHKYETNVDFFVNLSTSITPIVNELRREFDKLFLKNLEADVIAKFGHTCSDEALTYIIKQTQDTYLRQIDACNRECDELEEKIEKYEKFIELMDVRISEFKI